MTARAFAGVVAAAALVSLGCESFDDSAVPPEIPADPSEPAPPDADATDANRPDANGPDANVPGGTAPPEPAPRPTDEDRSLAGTRWRVAEVGGVPSVVGAWPTMDFRADGRVTGRTGVNEWFGETQPRGDGFVVAAVGSTLLAGPRDLMQQEARFLRALGAVRRFVVRGDGLDLVDASGRRVMRLRPD